MPSEPVTLVANQTINSGASSTWAKWPGGPGHLEVLGTFAGGGTLQLEKKAADGSTALSFGTPGLFSASGMANIDLPECEVRLTGATANTTAVVATLSHLRHWSR